MIELVCVCDCLDLRSRQVAGRASGRGVRRWSSCVAAASSSSISQLLSLGDHGRAGLIGSWKGKWLALNWANVSVFVLKIGWHLVANALQQSKTKKTKTKKIWIWPFVFVSHPESKTGKESISLVVVWSRLSKIFFLSLASDPHETVLLLVGNICTSTKALN